MPKILSVLIVLLILAGLFSPLTSMVNAYSSTTITLSTTIPLNNPYSQSLQSTSGKYVFAYLDTSTKKVNVYVYTSGGSLLSNKAVTLTNIGTTADMLATRIKLFEINSTFIGVAVVFPRYEGAGDRNSYINVILCNINSYDYSLQTSTSITAISTSTNPYIYTSSISYVKYSTKHYLFFKLNNKGSAINYLYCYEYNAVSRAVTQKSATNLGGSAYTDYDTPILLYQNVTNDADDIFLCTSTIADLTTPNFYRYSLDTFTIETMCAYPTTSFYSNFPNLQLINAGVKWDTSGYRYLVFVYNTPRYSATHTNRIIYVIMKFNGAITLANFDSVNARQILITYNIESGTNGYWIKAIPSNLTDLTIYYPYYDVGTTQYGNWKLVTHILNMYDMLDTTVSIVWDDSISAFSSTNIIPYVNFDDYIARIGYSTLQTNIVTNPSNIAYIYYDLTVMQHNYDVTLSWTPNENPLMRGENYRFHLTVYDNGIATQSDVVIFWDGGQIISQETDAYGVMEWIFFTIISGAHTFTVRVYDSDNVFQYTETFNVFWAGTISGDTVTDPTSNAISSSELIATFLKLTFVTLVPPAVMYGVMGNFGAIVGLVIGGYLAYSTGLIPPIIIYLIVLLVGVVFLGALMTFGRGQNNGRETT